MYNRLNKEKEKRWIEVRKEWGLGLDKFGDYGNKEEETNIKIQLVTSSLTNCGKGSSYFRIVIYTLVIECSWTAT